MKVTVRLPSMLAIGHSRHIQVEARTVAEALTRLDDAAPGMRGHLYEAGRLRPMVRVAVGETVLTHEEDLNIPLHEGDEIVVFQSIAGG